MLTEIPRQFHTHDPVIGRGKFHDGFPRALRTFVIHQNDLVIDADFRADRFDLFNQLDQAVAAFIDR